MTDFEGKVRSGYYSLKADNNYYRRKNGLPTEPDTFDRDLQEYLVSLGVPQKYVAKVAARAYDEGHANGYTEVFICAQGLAEIFV